MQPNESKRHNIRFISYIFPIFINLSHFASTLIFLDFLLAYFLCFFLSLLFLPIHLLPFPNYFSKMECCAIRSKLRLFGFTLSREAHLKGSYAFIGLIKPKGGSLGHSEYFFIFSFNLLLVSLMSSEVSLVFRLTLTSLSSDFVTASDCIYCCTLPLKSRLPKS